ncbi:NAD(P)/FAD-dependent oxidoreductase [Candidatus Leptofilum sp.]|uniref:NAD(P)/FAD-dependent oxidoreductase n=1 Tax=Candidatus Leptofilum sp. TaxID=3241576 RepID=UPI003B593843
MAEIQHVDILIVGSGPSGTSTALHLVKNNPEWAKRIVVVDKAVHPREKLCGGGVTHIGQNILARLGLPFEPQNFEVREVRLLYENQSYSFFGNPVFRIIRRDEFDHWLVKTAESLGVTVRQGEAVTDVVPHEDYVEVITEKAVFHAKTVVAADGSRSFVRRRLKWEDNSRVARLIEVLTPENARTQPEFRDGVAVFDFTPMTDHQLQGYYWDFPSYVDGQPYMNRGVFDSRARPERPKADLKQTLGDSMAARDRNLGDYKLKGHPIRWWGEDGHFSQPRVILVGDAAGTDPLFGEGISFALGYGEVAAEALEDAFTREDFSFETYKEKLRQHPLFVQLSIRTRLARFAYVLKYPHLFRAGWWMARHFIKFTRWRDPNYVPAELPTMRLTDRVQTT